MKQLILILFTALTLPLFSQEYREIKARPKSHSIIGESSLPRMSISKEWEAQFSHKNVTPLTHTLDYLPIDTIYHKVFYQNKDTVDIRTIREEISIIQPTIGYTSKMSRFLDSTKNCYFFKL